MAGTSKGSTAKKKKFTIPHMLLFPVTMLYLEFVLQISSGMGLSLGYPALFSLAGGMLLTAVTLPWSRKRNRQLSLILLFVLGLVYSVAGLIQGIYHGYFTPAAVLLGTGKAVAGESVTVVRGILSGLAKTICFMLPAGLYGWAGRKRMPAYHYPIPFAGVLLALSVVMFVVSSMLAGSAGSAPIYHGSGDFNEATQTFGLVTGVRLSLTGQLAQPVIPENEVLLEATPAEEASELEASSAEAPEEPAATEVSEAPAEAPTEPEEETTPEPPPPPTEEPAPEEASPPTEEPYTGPEPQKDPWELNPEGKIVYLTFDDGPGEYTQQLLDVLDKYNVKVTFFTVNTGHDDLLAKEAAAGHTVAIHTDTHNYETIYSSVDEYLRDFYAQQQRIYDATGIWTNLFRFPGGSSNMVSMDYCPGIMTELVWYMGEQGYQYFDWNVDSDDAGHATDSASVVQNVVTGIQQNDVSVVLQHDIKDYSVEAVERIIVWGLENGYTFLPLTENSPTAHHHVNN